MDDGQHGITTAPVDGGAQLAPGLVVYRFGAGLYYANASLFTEEITAIVERADPPLRMLVVLGSAIADVDYSGSDTLRQVHEELAARARPSRSPTSARPSPPSSTRTG